MKISGRDVSGFLKSPPADVRAVLFYGPDAGLVRERGGDMAATIGKRTGGDFDVTELTGDALKRDPALLADAAASLSLLGGEPVVRVRDAGDVIAPTVESWLESGGGNQAVVFEAGDLGPRAKLRALFEARKDAAAVGCYADDGRDLADVINGALKDANVRLAPDAMPVLLARLGTDRQAVRQEIEKLILYHGGPGADGPITLEEVEASIGDIRASSLDDMVFAMTSGDVTGLVVALDRSFSESTSPVAVIRAALRHVERLHQVKSARGTDVDGAMRRLRPPVFYKNVGDFKQAARKWQAADLSRAMSHLLAAERDCKSGLAVDREICERALMQLAQAARRFK